MLSRAWACSGFFRADKRPLKAGALTLDDNLLIIQAAADGLGIAYIPEAFAQKGLKSLSDLGSLRRKRKERPPWARRGEGLFSRIGLLSGGVVEKACVQSDGWKVIPNSAALTFREKARRAPPKDDRPRIRN